MKNTHTLRWPGHWLILVLTFALLLGLHAAPAFAQNVFMTINNPQVTTPGSYVTFTGSLTNPNAESLTLSNSTFTLLDYSPLVPGQTGDFSLITLDSVLVPVQIDAVATTALSPGAPPVTDLFSLFVDPAAAPGEYSGTFSLTYTGKSSIGKSSIDYLSPDTPFKLTVNAPAPAAVPEPSTWAVFVFGGLGVLGMTLRARRRKVSTNL